MTILFFKHLIFILLGLIIIFVISSMSQDRFLKFSLFIFIVSLILLILVPFMGVEVKGSKRWIDLYFLPRFQPIELVKPFLIIVISLILSNQKYGNIYLKYILTFLATLLIALFLIFQPDIGQTFLVFLSWSILIFVSGANMFSYQFCFYFLSLFFYI